MIISAWPKFRGTSFTPPKGTSLYGTTHFEPSLVQIGRTVRPVALAKKPKKRQWQTGYSPRPPMSPYRCQSLHAGWSPVCSSIFQVLLKSFKVVKIALFDRSYTTYLPLHMVRVKLKISRLAGCKFAKPKSAEKFRLSRI